MGYGDDANKSGYEAGGYQEGNSQSSYNNDRGNQNSGYGSGGYRPRGNNPYNQGSQGQSRNFSNFRRGPGGNGNQPPRDFNLDPPILYRPYTVVGNRDVPDDGIQKLRDIRNILDANEFTARTNGGDGPGAVFLEARHKELILPWRNFAGHDSKLTFSTEEAKWFAKKYQPDYDNIPKDTVKGILAGNVRLVCGQNLKSPSMFLITWTKDGCEDSPSASKETGFSKHPIDIAYDLRVPIFNFARSDAKERLMRQFRLTTPSV